LILKDSGVSGVGGDSGVRRFLTNLASSVSGREFTRAEKDSKINLGFSPCHFALARISHGFNLKNCATV
jgi:hypothetical protein